MTKLNGSQKQIAWAENMRDNSLASIEKALAICDTKMAKYIANGKEGMIKRQQEEIDNINELKTAIIECTDASEIIDCWGLNGVFAEPWDCYSIIRSMSGRYQDAKKRNALLK